MAKERLTPQQQKNTDQRTLSNAELIKGGAKTDESGRLELTEEQMKDMEGKDKKRSPEYQHLKRNYKLILELEEIIAENRGTRRIILPDKEGDSAVGEAKNKNRARALMGWFESELLEQNEGKE